ncbi:MAG: HPF/RaiA family ribosome-associated protein [Bacteroidia bacterium]
MEITIQPPPIGGSKGLSDYVNKELTAFAKLAPGASRVEVRLRQDKGYAGENKICEIYLSTAQKNIFAVQKGRTYEESTAKAIQKLQKQLGDPVK